MLSIGQLITAALLKFFWVIFIQGPLQIVSYAADAIKYLTQGIFWNIFFNTNGVYKNGVIVPPNINDVKIPWIFIGFVIISIFIGFLVFIWQLIKVTTITTNDTKMQKKGIINAIKFFILGFLVCFSIPALFFVLIAIMGFLSEAINLAFIGSSNKTSIADFLYLLGAPSGFNGPVPSNFSAPDDSVILNYNMLVECLGSWFALFALLIISWVIMLKVAELFFLMIISPFLAFSMPLDDGKRIISYKNLVISKALVILGNLIMYYVYVILLSLMHTSISNSNWFDANGGNEAKAIVELAFIAGSSMTVFSASSLIGSFIGESTGVKEGMDTLRGFAGLVGTAGAAGIINKGLGFTKPSNFLKTGEKLAEQKGGKLVSGIGSKIQAYKHNKIDKKMSNNEISLAEGKIMHEKVGKNFWRKKKLDEMQRKQHLYDQQHGFKNNFDYINSQEEEKKGTTL